MMRNYTTIVSPFYISHCTNMFQDFPWFPPHVPTFAHQGPLGESKISSQCGAPLFEMWVEKTPSNYYHRHKAKREIVVICSPTERYHRSSINPTKSPYFSWWETQHFPQRFSPWFSPRISTARCATPRCALTLTVRGITQGIQLLPGKGPRCGATILVVNFT